MVVQVVAQMILMEVIFNLKYQLNKKYQFLKKNFMNYKVRLLIYMTLELNQLFFIVIFRY